MKLLETNTASMNLLLKKRLDNPDCDEAMTFLVSLHLHCRPAETAKLVAFSFVEFSI